MVERSRKEVEHRVMSQEEAIDKLERDIRDARFLTDEASRKFDEATYKIEKIDQALARALTRAEKAEAAVGAMEGQLLQTGNGLSRSAANKEKSQRREEQLKRQLKHLKALLEEAEHRADAESEEQEKLQARVDYYKRRLKK